MPESAPIIFFLSALLTVLALYGRAISPGAAVASFVQKMWTNPQAAELFRFIFLGTIVETGRRIGESLLAVGSNLFVVKAEFVTRDFAYDWVLNYLEHHRVLNESRSFKVVARNASSRPNASSALGRLDGAPDPIYEPAPERPAFFRWKGYWISVNKSVAGYAHYDTGEEVGGTLTISIWSRKRQILDDFVREARQFYIESKVLPRKVEREKEPSGSLLTAVFQQADASHDWMLAYLRSTNALEDTMDFTISTKQTDLGWGNGPKDGVRYLPAHDTKQRFLFTSPNTGRSTWLQVVVTPGQVNWNSHTATGGSITITLHSSDKTVLADLIDCAHKRYLEAGVSKVTVHLTDNRGEWAKTITKSRRALSTLILPLDIKEMLLADARKFLESETWYNQAGIPHRRGYLLYGEPGTGKSSTIHALAGELGLEIYFISLASPGIDDYSLAKLISDTPSRCILLIEDIDCAFPSRDELDDEDEDAEPILDKDGKSWRAQRDAAALERDALGPVECPRLGLERGGAVDVCYHEPHRESRFGAHTCWAHGHQDPIQIRRLPPNQPSLQAILPPPGPSLGHRLRNPHAPRSNGPSFSLHRTRVGCPRRRLRSRHPALHLLHRPDPRLPADEEAQSRGGGGGRGAVARGAEGGEARVGGDEAEEEGGKGEEGESCKGQAGGRRCGCEGEGEGRGGAEGQWWTGGRFARHDSVGCEWDGGE